MTTEPTEHGRDPWGDGESYEQYMGRWSRKIAREFVDWLAQQPGLDWLDIGCGTGALTGVILEQCAPRTVVGVDPSAPFVDYARHAFAGRNVRFEVGNAGALPVPDSAADVIVSALAFNFFPDRAAALAEMRRAARPSATISFYVWDYPGGGMGFMDAFWAAAIALEPAAASAGERSRFPFCTPEILLDEVRTAGLVEPEIRPIEVTAAFADFDDLWLPFTRGTGPAPVYYKRLGADAQEQLKHSLEESVRGLETIQFPARAWALRCREP